MFKLITAEKPKSPIAEAYRTLRTNLQFTAVDGDLKKILITSAGPNEGKSSVIANLGITMTQTGKKVLIIDADMRNPTQHKLFSLPNTAGLSTVLAMDMEADKAWQETPIEDLKILSAGPIPPNPAELLGSKRMKHLLEEVSAQFDMILIDSPPTIAVVDSSVLAQLVDGVILVLAYGEVNRDYALQAKEQLDKVKAKILGTVLNKVEMKSKEHYYYYYYGDKHSHTGQSHKKKKKKKTNTNNIL